MNKNFDKNDLKNRLSEESYRVTQEKGTEYPFSGALVNNKDSGMYSCIVCGETLFASDTKYDSGSGWPSFWDTIDKSKIKFIEDHSHGMVRTEIECANCNAHLGHVFPDGPQPSNTRYCVNSASLDFKKK